MLKSGFAVGFLGVFFFLSSAAFSIDLHVSSTSRLKAAKAYSYGPASLFDGDRKTPWAEGLKGDGVGQSIRMHLVEKTMLTEIFIVNGFADPTYFEQNGRVCVLDVAIGEDYHRVFQLSDSMEPQYLKLTRPVEGDSIVLTILSTFAGKRWDDTCLSEVGLVGKSGPISLKVVSEQAEAASGFTDGTVIERSFDSSGIEFRTMQKILRAGVVAEKTTANRSRFFSASYTYSGGRLDKKSTNDFVKDPSSIGEYEYQYKNGRIETVKETREGYEEPSVYLHRYSYGVSGLQTIETTVNGRAYSREVFSYEPMGLVKVAEKKYSEGRFDRTEYQYFGKRLITETRFRSGSTPQTTKYSYVGDKLVGSTGLTEFGNPGSQEYFYDAAARLKFIVSYDAQSQFESIHEFSFDGSNLVGEVTYADWYYQNTEKFSYDARGLLVESKEFFDENLVASYIYISSDGQVSERRKASSTEVTRYEYDSEGRLKREVGPYQNLTEHLFEGNLLVKTMIRINGSTTETMLIRNDNGVVVAKQERNDLRNDPTTVVVDYVGATF